jgi:hypothetical protein
MRVKVHVFSECDEGSTESVDNIIHLKRGNLQPVDLDLTLAEARTLLQNM